MKLPAGNGKLSTVLGPAELKELGRTEWIHLSVRRTFVRLDDGRECVLVGAEKRRGKARVEFFDGNRRTVKLTAIVEAG